MPKITLFPNGINAAQTSAGNPAPPVRGSCRGWTQNAALRNERFLMSVRLPNLSGLAYTFTFTLRDTPKTSAEWDRLKRNLFERWRKRGMVRLHYVTEWQRRGAPHLHGVVFFRWSNPRHTEAQERAFDLRWDWCQVAAKWQPLPHCQLVRLEEDLSVGWFVYLAKHASRGAAHYQRQRQDLPKGWTTTGRMWGVRGEWPTDRQEYEVSRNVFFRFRRFAMTHLRKRAEMDLRQARASTWPDRKERIARAKARVLYLRAKLSTGRRESSEVRAIAEWMEPKIRDELLLAALRAAPPAAEPVPYQPQREALTGRLLGATGAPSTSASPAHTPA